ncbi:Uncharacterized protein APZ42_004841 [Daphnia magna]|uniref:Uncharacterized protein n=1 Tax=Daphnia magna TaxID=35525 RepID=A0A164GTA0_9CRUS|nr:Uncharacterized protein APZ42_004841 [Daphnia magna]
MTAITYHLKLLGYRAVLYDKLCCTLQICFFEGSSSFVLSDRRMALFSLKKFNMTVEALPLPLKTIIGRAGII